MIGESWTVNSSEFWGQMMLGLKAFGSIAKVNATKTALTCEGFGSMRSMFFQQRKLCLRR